MATDEQIREMAFSIWEKEGRPEGKETEHYYRAKKILEEREAKQLLELATKPPPVELAELPKSIPLPPALSKRSIRSRHKKK